MFLNIFLIFLICLLIDFSVGTLVEPSIWPEPMSITYKNESAVKPISSKLIWIVDGGNIDTLNDLFNRYMKMMFIHPTPDPTSPNNDNDETRTIFVQVKDRSEEYPQLETSEYYELRIEENSAEIYLKADTIYGVIRGVETLAQITVYDFDELMYRTPTLIVKDQPRYLHRGMLLDTSRHFQPITFLRKTIDALSYSKYNVLHWHVVDTQSFPFQSQTSPKLWEGSYTKNERYSTQDMIALVEYGRRRGVKVMIEFDVPGHQASWCTGYPQICPSTTCLQPLNPASDDTMPLVEGLLKECTTIMSEDQKQALFPYKLIHLGGDEVDYKCWNKSPEIQEWQKQQGYEGDGNEDTYKYFVDGVSKMALDLNRLPVQWVEVFEHFGSDLRKDTIVHVWKEKTTLDEVVQAGYKALLSNQNDWYLDHETTSWETMYENEPTSDLTDPSTASLILGGESCMWAENVDISVLENTVWPRAAAVAERLWTPKDKMDVVRAADRIETFRCVLATRGIGAAPVKNHYARKAPKEPGSCYDQRRR